MQATIGTQSIGIKDPGAEGVGVDYAASALQSWLNCGTKRDCTLMGNVNFGTKWLQFQNMPFNSFCSHPLTEYNVHTPRRLLRRPRS